MRSRRYFVHVVDTGNRRLAHFTFGTWNHSKQKSIRFDESERKNKKKKKLFFFFLVEQLTRERIKKCREEKNKRAGIIQAAAGTSIWSVFENCCLPRRRTCTDGLSCAAVTDRPLMMPPRTTNAAVVTSNKTAVLLRCCCVFPSYFSRTVETPPRRGGGGGGQENTGLWARRRR